jgi:hypothetical protein
MDPDPHLLLLLDVERMLQLLRESVCLAVGHPAKHRGGRGNQRLWFSFDPLTKNGILIWGSRGGYKGSAPI